MTRYRYEAGRMVPVCDTVYRLRWTGFESEDSPSDRLGGKGAAGCARLEPLEANGEAVAPPQTSTFFAPTEAVSPPRLPHAIPPGGGSFADLSHLPRPNRAQLRFRGDEGWRL